MSPTTAGSPAAPSSCPSARHGRARDRGTGGRRARLDSSIPSPRADGDAVVLAAAGLWPRGDLGVMQWLEEHGRGFAVSRTVVPHVAAPSSSISPWRPSREARPGHGPCRRGGGERGPRGRSSVGAARAPPSASSTASSAPCAAGWRGPRGRAGIVTAALMVVNAVETCVIPPRAAPRGRPRRARWSAARGYRAALAAGASPPRFRPAHTTIGVVATTAGLSKAEAARVARLGLAGFGRALSPPHLDTDGDCLFCLSIGHSRRTWPAWAPPRPRRWPRPSRGPSCAPCPARAAHGAGPLRLEFSRGLDDRAVYFSVRRS